MTLGVALSGSEEAHGTSEASGSFRFLFQCCIERKLGAMGKREALLVYKYSVSKW
jgi:hypothetical protein